MCPTSRTHDFHGIEIWQNWDHFGTTMPSEYTSEKRIDCFLQGKMGEVYPCPLSHHPCAPVPIQLAERPKGQVAIGYFGIKIKICNILMVWLVEEG